MVGMTPWRSDSGALPANVYVSDRRQWEAVSRGEASVEAASCSLDAMVILSIDQSAENMLRDTRPSWVRKMTEVEFLGF